MIEYYEYLISVAVCGKEVSLENDFGKIDCLSRKKVYYENVEIKTDAIEKMMCSIHANIRAIQIKVDAGLHFTGSNAHMSHKHLLILELLI